MDAKAHVRHAREDDLPAINDIYNDAILTSTATWDERPWTPDERRRWLAEHDAANPVLVAEAGGRVAGFAYLSMYRPKSGYRFTRESTIYLHRSQLGRGIGTVLLGALLDEARAIGVHCLVACIAGDNRASFALHRKLGFAYVGTKRECGFKFGAWQDLAEMTLILPPGEAPQ